MAPTFKISDEVRDVLRAAEITETTVRITQQLDRALYVQVNKVLEGAGGKWNRKAKAHVFSRDPRESLGLAVETGAAENRQQRLQAFYTPDALADRVAELAECAEGHLLLDPSAGHGALLDAVRRRLGKDVGATAIEVDDEAFPILHEKGYVGTIIDFLTVEPADVFDRIVMNPPFTKGQDIEHVTHALKFLKPGGRLVAIMSPTWQTKQERRSAEFRKLVSGQCKVQEVPPGTFADTDVWTVIVVVDPEVA
jgi:predicted RNA methylase